MEYQGSQNRPLSAGARATAHRLAGTVSKYSVLFHIIAWHSKLSIVGQSRFLRLWESFFSALKNERVYRTVYATKERARYDVIAYIGLAKSESAL